MPVAEKDAPSKKAPRVQMLPVDRLRPSPENGRQAVSAKSLKSLARSIRKNGVLQPIIVRVHPTEEDAWEIRAGHRRWRAAKLAGLDTVPAIVRSLDNGKAMTVTITENLERENLHPLEEAVVFQQALDNGDDAEAVASRLGRTPQFVARRASLTHLSEDWRKAVLIPESPASRLSPAHLELIARLPDETQNALAEDDFYSVFGRGFPSVDDLRRIIDGGLRSLGAMPWSPDDETIDPQAGSCRNCPKRSGAQPLLFDEEVGPTNGKLSKQDRCLDPACFDRKQVAHVQRCEAERRQANPELKLVQIGSSSMSPTATDAFGDRVQRVYAPKFVKAGARNAVPAMQVDGPKAGKLVYIESHETPQESQDQRRGGKRPKEERKPATLDERRQKHNKRRQAFVVQQVQTRLREFTVEDVTKALATGEHRSDAQMEIVSLLLSFGTTGRADRSYHDDPWDRYDRLRSEPAEGRVAAALHDVVQIWVRRLLIQDGNRVPWQADEARRMCAILGIDYAAIEAEAVRALPQPKSWGLPPEEIPTAAPPHDASTQDVPVAPASASPDDAEPKIAPSRGKRRLRPSRTRPHGQARKRGRQRKGSKVA